LATFDDATVKLLPEGSLIKNLTATLEVPTVGTVSCRDFPIFVETEADEDLRLTLVKFAVEVVVAK